MTDNRLEQLLFGAYSDQDQLIAARFAAKDLKLHQRRRALSQLAGPNKTNFRGRGLDFAEVRAYQPGDDIRSIDWRVTARSTKPYTKLFQEERERPILVVTDQRQPMFFGSQCCFKSVTACYLSALIAWSGLQHGDRVGGMVFGNDSQREIRPRRSRQSVLALLHRLLEFNQRLNKDSGTAPHSGERLAEALRELRRVAKPGSAIYLISDFSGFTDDSVIKQLYQLSQHCEITGLYIYDPMEQTLPPPGYYTVTDGSQRAQVFTGGKQQRHHYQQQFDNRLAELHQLLGRGGIPLIEIATTDAPLKRLLHFYGARR